MRRRALLSLAVIGMFLAGSAAISMAGGWHSGASSDTYGPGESHPSMLGGSGETTADPGTFESQEPVEAGKIPSHEGGMISGGEFRGGEEVQTVESGGLQYRLEIDAGA